MPARKKPPVSDALAAPALGGGVGVLFAEFVVKTVHDESLKGFLTVLTPVITVAVSGLYFVYVLLIDLAIARFIRAIALKKLKDAEKDPNSSPEYKRKLREKWEEYESASFADLADSYRQMRRGRK